MAYTFKVNGKSRTVDVEGDTPLLWVLRDTLDMKGTKFGCGIESCGACIVHVDGRIMHACALPVSGVDGHNVSTVEGMSEHPVGRKVQAAWQDLDVPQCGYCQAGQIMSATALLVAKPHPTDADIDAAMAGNACRCATYTRIRAAIKKAAGLPTNDTRA